jgi:GTP cyclohydrolase I
MTSQIVECIVDLLKPRGAACLVRGQHLCMMARGVEQQKAAMTTSALRGVFLKDSAARAEFMSLSETK